MNRIYFFTGTGNSLHIAKEIATTLIDCEIVAIHEGMDMNVPSGYNRIGFVFPTYGWGLPIMVANFFKCVRMPEQSDTYLFAVTTCGGLALNAIPQANSLLIEKGCHLNYGASIRMFRNSITHYNMSAKVDIITQKSDKRALPIIRDIMDKKVRQIASIIRLFYRLYLKFIEKIPTRDQDFNINSDCISCGICQSVCPAKNIILEEGKPVFHHKCENCTACIQYCPKKAVNYKDKTQKRRRYTHPQVDHAEISKYYTS
jgi:ferredoxin